MFKYFKKRKDISVTHTFPLDEETKSKKDEINISSDYPTIIEANRDSGRHYYLGADATDNDPTKTNTGAKHLMGQYIMWDGASSYWLCVGKQEYIEAHRRNSELLDYFDNALLDVGCELAVQEKKEREKKEQEQERIIESLDRIEKKLDGLSKDISRDYRAIFNLINNQSTSEIGQHVNEMHESQ